MPRPPTTRRPHRRIPTVTRRAQTHFGSYWVSAVDPRVKLSVPVCSVTTFDYWIRSDVNWDWHQRPAGNGRIADIGTLLALHAALLKPGVAPLLIPIANGGHKSVFHPEVGTRAGTFVTTHLRGVPAEIDLTPIVALPAAKK